MAWPGAKSRDNAKTEYCNVVHTPNVRAFPKKVSSGQAAKLAWQRILDFFKKNLKQRDKNVCPVQEHYLRPREKYLRSQEILACHKTRVDGVLADIGCKLIY